MLKKYTEQNVFIAKRRKVIEETEALHEEVTQSPIKFVAKFSRYIYSRYTLPAKSMNNLKFLSQYDATHHIFLRRLPVDTLRNATQP